MISKDYKNIQLNTQGVISRGRFESIFFFLIGLACGLCVAVVVYLYKYDFEEEVLVVVPLEAPIIVEKKEPSASPIFDFYQILPNVTVNISEWEADDIEERQTTVSKKAAIIENKESIESVPQPTPQAATSNVYILQIGSFKEYVAAVMVQDKIDLMGLTSDIQRVVIHGTDVRYRVRMGPYKEIAELVHVRKKLTQHDLSYIVLKLQ